LNGIYKRAYRRKKKAHKALKRHCTCRTAQAFLYESHNALGLTRGYEAFGRLEFKSNSRNNSVDFWQRIHTKQQKNEAVEHAAASSENILSYIHAPLSNRNCSPERRHFLVLTVTVSDHAL
jgi:hypothetical protein